MRTCALALLGLGAFVIAGCARTIELVDGGAGGADGDSVGSGPTGSGAGATGNASGSGPGSSGSGAVTSSGSGGPGSSSSSGPGSSGSGPGSSGSGGVTSSGSVGSGPSSGSVGSSGSGGVGSSGSGTMECAAFDACTSCIASSCPDVWCSCTNNPDCFALYDCAGGCGNDESCVTNCYATHSDGLSAAVLVADCAASPCDGSCNWGGDPLDPCSKCLYTSCDDEMNACAAEPECTVLWECLGTCGPVQLSCHQACYNAHPSGVEPLGDLLGCSEDSCTNTCN